MSVAISPQADEPEESRLQAAELSASQGAVRLSNSRDGHAIVSGHNLAPGRPRSGGVSVRVEGARTRVNIAVRRVRPSPLSRALRVQVRQTARGSTSTVYRGSLENARRVQLGRWRPGEGRRFNLTVKLPRSPRPQNYLEGERTSFAVVWRARPDFQSRAWRQPLLRPDWIASPEESPSIR